MKQENKTNETQRSLLHSAHGKPQLLTLKSEEPDGPSVLHSSEAHRVPAAALVTQNFLPVEHIGKGLATHEKVHALLRVTFGRIGMLAVAIFNLFQQPTVGKRVLERKRTIVARLLRTNTQIHFTCDM